LFVPFQELRGLQGVSKAEHDTLGLGLSASQIIASKLNGDITIKQSKTGLTVIAFKIPVTIKKI